MSEWTNQCSDDGARGSVLIVSPRLPEFDRQSGERRNWHLVQFLREAGWSVTFIATQNAVEDRYHRMLRQSGVATYVGDRHLERVVRSTRFDMALLAFWDV